MSASPNAQRGVAPQRVDFAREDYLGDGAFGVTPTDPEFQKYSDAISALNTTPSAVIERRGGIGTADPVDFQRGPETHEMSITYDVVKYIGSATGDAVYDGLVRQADELLPDSHTVVVREDKTHVNASSTVGGGTARPTRLYLYGRGGLINEGTVMGNASEQQPLQVEMTYMFQYLRAQQIDQPTADEADTFLTVRSTDSADTGVSVTIESEGAGTSEDVNTDGSDGTEAVSTSSEFGDIDAIYVAGDHAGDIVVSINEGDDTSPTEGDELARIFGEAQYNGVESDYGVPPLGSGSRESVSSLSDPERFIGDTIEADASPYPYEIQGVNLTFSNNVESTEVADRFGMTLLPGNRELGWESTVFGENVSIDALQAHFQNEAREFTWEMDGGTMTLEGSHLVEPGEIALETGQAVMTVENAWDASGISFS